MKQAIELAADQQIILVSMTVLQLEHGLQKIYPNAF